MKGRKALVEKIRDSALPFHWGGYPYLLHILLFFLVGQNRFERWGDNSLPISNTESERSSGRASITERLEKLAEMPLKIKRFHLIPFQKLNDEALDVC